MRDLVGRLKHRDAVLDNLHALLLAYPRGRQFSDDFPKLKSVIRDHFNEGVAAPLSALQIAETIVGNFVRQLDAAEKAAALRALIATGRLGFAEVAQRRMQGGRDEVADNSAFVARLAGIAIFMAGRLAGEGSLSRHDFQGFVERLAAALGGDARQGQSLIDSFG